MGPLVLIGKDLVLEGSTTKIEDKQVPYIYNYMTICIFPNPRCWENLSSGRHHTCRQPIAAGAAKYHFDHCHRRSFGGVDFTVEGPGGRHLNVEFVKTPGGIVWNEYELSIGVYIYR